MQVIEKVHMDSKKFCFFLAPRPILLLHFPQPFCSALVQSLPVEKLKTSIFEAETANC